MSVIEGREFVLDSLRWPPQPEYLYKNSYLDNLGYQKELIFSELRFYTPAIKILIDVLTSI